MIQYSEIPGDLPIPKLEVCKLKWGDKRLRKLKKAEQIPAYFDLNSSTNSAPRSWLESLGVYKYLIHVPSDTESHDSESAYLLTVQFKNMETQTEISVWPRNDKQMYLRLGRDFLRDWLLLIGLRSPLDQKVENTWFSLQKYPPRPVD